MRRILSFAAAGLLAVGLVACQSETAPEAAKSTAGMGPAETIEATASALRAGDFVALAKASLPAAKYEQAKAEWANKVKSEPASEQDKKEFAEMMAKLTAADAEDKLYAELEPQLAKMEAEMGAQLPLMIGMGRGFVAQSISESTELNDNQKQQATQLVDAVAKWVEGARFFDRDNAKKAIAKVVATARGLEISSLDQVEAMDFEQMLGKAGKVYLGARDVFAVYGLDIDAALASVKAETVSENGDAAKVKVNYSLFGTALSAETDLVRRDERWFGKEAMVQLEKELAAPAAAPAEAVAADDEGGEEEETEAAE